MRKSWMKDSFFKWNAEGTMLQSTATDQRRADASSAPLRALQSAIVQRVKFGAQSDLDAYLTFHDLGGIFSINKPTQASDCLLALAWCQAWKKPMNEYLSI